MWTQNYLKQFAENYDGLPRTLSKALKTVQNNGYKGAKLDKKGGGRVFNWTSRRWSISSKLDYQ
jgi:hypothetical protein